MTQSNCRFASKASVAAFLAAGTSGLFGCGPRDDVGSKLFHDVDDPTHSTLSHQWRDVSDSDYRQFMAPLLRLPNDFVADDHPVTERMQEWIDRVDSNLRKQHPSQMAGVPKPKARVIPNPSLNAFIAPIPVCYDIEVRVGDNSMPTIDQIFFDIGEGSFDVWPADEISCQPAGDSKQAVSEVAEAIRAFNELSSACKISLEKEGDKKYLAPNDQCEGSRDLARVGASRQLVLLRSANWVNIYSGLISSMSEREVVGVIAHELGHYYRSHMNAPRRLYDFFYKSGQEVAPERPKPVPAMQNAGKRALAASKVIGTLQRYKPVAGQKVHSAMFMALGQLALSVCQNGAECPTSCETVRQLVDESSFQQRTYLFPFRALNADGLKAYEEFEGSAMECLESVPVVKDATEKGDGVTYDDVLRAVLRPRWPNWLGSDADLMRAVRKWMISVAMLLPETAPKKATDAASLVKALSGLLRKEDRNSMDAIKSAFEMKLGHYTDEQEADEISVEWLSELGVDPKAAVETYLKIGRWMEQEGRRPSEALLEVDSVRCTELANNDWKDRDGKFTFIPLGDLSDTHHQTCYRAFNVDREIRSHRYKVQGNGNRGLLTGEKWAELQELAKKVTAEENYRLDDNSLSVGVSSVETVSAMDRAGTDRFFNAEVRRHAGHAHHFAGSGCVFSPF